MELQQKKNRWDSNEVLRLIYTDWYEQIIQNLSNIKGQNIELGSGIGQIKNFIPDITTSDISKNSFVDLEIDAQKLPFVNTSIANIVMIDVLHHVPNPMLFFTEALRVLKPKGRILLIEPYPTIWSYFFYKIGHPEPFNFSSNYFAKNLPKIINNIPDTPNQAVPYLLFFKQNRKFLQYFDNKFIFVKKQKFSFLAYPLSGGYSKSSLISKKTLPLINKIEYFLKPLAFFIAFRCFVVIEKK